MESKAVASLVASLISQTLVCLLLHFPRSNPKPIINPLLSLSSQIQTSSSLLSHKRKRNQNQNPEVEEENGDEEDENQPQHPSSLCTALTHPNPNPDHFNLSFNMSSSTFEFLSGLLDPLLDSRGLPGPVRLAVGLSRLSTGAPYSQIAAHFSISEHVARFCTKRLCRVLCTNFRFWVAFPSDPDEISVVSNGFRVVSNGLNDCCGAISCARFEIGDGQFVAAQIVADSSSRILSVSAGFRGERGDGDVLKRSRIYEDVEKGQILRGGRYFVGGVGYPLLPWLVVPFENAGCGSVEEEFNGVHGLMLRPVERAVSGLRNWGVLGRLLEEEDRRMVAACIGTCAILHNILAMREDCDGFSDVSVQGGVNVEDCRGLVEKCHVEVAAIHLCGMLAKKASTTRNSGQNSKEVDSMIWGNVRITMGYVDLTT